MYAVLLITCFGLAPCILAQTAAKAGFRKMKPEEISFLNKTHEVLFAAIPHEYKDWKAQYDNRRFDATEYWCDPQTAMMDCNGMCPQTEGVGDAWALSYNVEFAMPANKSNALKGASAKMVTDYSDPTQLANAQKYTAKTKLKVTVVNNMSAGDVAVNYCDKTPFETISLPVTATLAIISRRSADCPILDGSRPSMKGDYYDNAIIVLGKPVTRKATAKTNDGLTTSRYVVGFDKSKIGRLATQNVVVQIKGDADDIKAYINSIDWQKLYGMLE